MSIVQWSKASLKFLDRLDQKESARIFRKINKIKDNPMRFIKSLVDKNFGKIRIGDYRVFVDFLRKEERLIVRSIKHRKNAYK